MQLLREHPAIGAILQNALARCIGTITQELGRHHLVTNRGNFSGHQVKVQKETQLTASINKLVLQSELFNCHDIHGHDIGSAVQASLLSNKSALASRISSSQGRSASTAGSPTKTPGGRNLSLTPPLSPMDTPQGDKRARKDFLTKEGASTPRGLTGLRGKGPSSIHPQPAQWRLWVRWIFSLDQSQQSEEGTTALLYGSPAPGEDIQMSVSEGADGARIRLNHKTITTTAMKTVTMPLTTS